MLCEFLALWWRGGSEDQSEAAGRSDASGSPHRCLHRSRDQHGTDGFTFCILDYYTNTDWPLNDGSLNVCQAASIPDYRGPNGVWTQLQKGRAIRWVGTRLSSSFHIDVLSHSAWTNRSIIHSLSTRHSDLSEADPTLTHMCIQMLHKVKMVSVQKSSRSKS